MGRPLVPVYYMATDDKALAIFHHAFALHTFCLLFPIILLANDVLNEYVMAVLDFSNRTKC